MSENAENSRQLTSWKEISRYLGRDIRTCLRWEKKHGLPVHRVDPESPKSRVYAFKDELDEWLRSPNHRRILESPSRRHSPSRRTLMFGAVLVLAAAGILLAVLLTRHSAPSEPADFRIEGSALVILSSKGKELWRYETQAEDLFDHDVYRGCFQVKKPNSTGGISLPLVMFKDLNRDGATEVLFATRTKTDRAESHLICFSGHGKELWRFKGGRAMECGSRLFSSHFNIGGFDVLDINGDGSLEIVVISYQPPNWLTQLAVLDANGRTLGEYWNSGHLNDFIVQDLDADGRKELLVVGLNNEYAKACLIVFDPGRIAGGSPQTKEEYICRGVQRGSELFYLLFPRTDVDTALNPVECAAEVYAEDPGILNIETAISGIYFILDFRLTVRDVTLSHGFMMKHREALLAGKIKSNLDDPAYKEALKRGVLYYDGRGWIPRPARVAYSD